MWSLRGSSAAERRRYGTVFGAAMRRVLSTGACLPNQSFRRRLPKDGGAAPPDPRYGAKRRKYLAISG